MSRVATRANMISATATTQLTTIELVMGKPKGRAIATAGRGRRGSSGSAIAAGKLRASAAPWPAASFVDLADPA
jgi:hypothetical protein